MNNPDKLPESFKAKFIVHKDGCWRWTASCFFKGYGQYYCNGKVVRAHKYSYEFFNGHVPLGLELDHLCRNRACVNPNHMEAVTQRINNMRGIGFAAVNAKKIQCVNGHEFSPENTYYRPNSTWRVCRECALHRNRKSVAKKRQAS